SACFTVPPWRAEAGVRAPAISASAISSVRILFIVVTPFREAGTATPVPPQEPGSTVPRPVDNRPTGGGAARSARSPTGDGLPAPGALRRQCRGGNAGHHRGRGRPRPQSRQGLLTPRLHGARSGNHRGGPASGRGGTPRGRADGPASPRRQRPR